MAFQTFHSYRYTETGCIVTVIFYVGYITKMFQVFN